MRVLVAGATGVLGRPLWRPAGTGPPGHRARTGPAPGRRAPRPTVVVADALDRAPAVGGAAARPDVVVHQLTALRGARRPAEPSPSPRGCVPRAPPT